MNNPKPDTSTERARAARERFQLAGGCDIAVHLHGPLVKALDALRQGEQSRQDVIVRLIEQAQRRKRVERCFALTPEKIGKAEEWLKGIL